MLVFSASAFPITDTFTPTPVCCNPLTFGKTDAGSSNEGYPSWVISNKYTAAQDGTASSISIYVFGNAGSQVQVGIYSDSSGPHTLLAMSAPTVTAAGWNTITIPDTAISAGTSYWIAMQTQGVLTIAYDTGTAGSAVSTASTNPFGTFPDPFGPQATSSELFSMYVNYCPLSCNTATFTLTPTPSATPSFTPTFTFTPVSTPVCDSEGNTHIGDFISSTFTTGYMFASRYYLNVGTIQQINVYCSGGATGNVAVALYSDIAGAPGTSIISSGSQGMVNGWNSVPLDYDITTSGYYWIAFQFSTNGPSFNSDTVGVPDNSENTASTVGIFPTWPGTWSSVSSNMALFSMYAVDCNIITATMTPTPVDTITFTMTPATPSPTSTAVAANTALPVATLTPTPAAVYSLVGNIITDGVVNAVAADNSGIFLGGLFNYVGPWTGQGVVLDTGAGSTIPGMPQISGGPSYGVETAIPDGAGGWYIGGDFNMASGQPRNRIAHILPNGVVDANFAASANGTVMALALDGNGNLFIGGFFTVVNSQARNYIAELNAVTGALSGTFNPSIVGSYVQSFAINGNSLYVGGTYTNITGQNISCLAKLDITSGAADLGFNANPNATAHSILLDGAGKLYVAGDFSSIGGQPYAMLARVDAATGLADTGFNPVIDNVMQTMTLDGNGGLYIGGWFTHVNGAVYDYIARLSTATGLPDPNFNPAANNPVYSLALDGAGNIYAGGGFTSIGGAPRGRVAKMNATTGAIDNTFAPYADNNVEAVDLDGNGKIFIGGLFNSIGGGPRQNIARLNAADMTLDNNFNINCSNSVFCLLLGGATESLYVGGGFNNIASAARLNLAKLDPKSGAADINFNPGPGAPVYALALDGSSNLYVGGIFTIINGALRPHLAKINAANGTVDATFNATGADSNVYSLALDGNGNLYAGGIFANIGGVPENLISKLDTVSGNGDPAFNAAATGTSVAAMALDGAGKIYAAGLFTSMGGLSRGDMARLNALTGAGDAAFTVSSDNAVDTLLTDGGGNIYTGGNFGAIGGYPIGFLVKIGMSAGTVDPAFNMLINNSVNALCLSPDRATLYAGGSFTSIGGKPFSNFAAIRVVAATPTFTATPTMSYTYTATLTFTNTATATPTNPVTFTNTPTATATSRATLTPAPTPDDNNVLDKNYADVSKGDVVNIRVNIAASGTAVNVKVYNLTGGVVRKFSAISTAAGWNDITWDVKNDGGRTVGQGLYFIEIESQGIKKLRRIYILK